MKNKTDFGKKLMIAEEEINVKVNVCLHGNYLVMMMMMMSTTPEQTDTQQRIQFMINNRVVTSSLSTGTQVPPDSL